MPVLAPFEQNAMDKGRLEGKFEEAQISLLDDLQEKFGTIPTEIMDAIHALNDVALVRRLRKQARNADSLSDWIPYIREAGK